MKLTLFSVVMFAGLLLSIGAQGDEPVLTTTPSRQVRIADCRIVLIDHATLACDRTGTIKSIECKEGQNVGVRQLLAVITDDVARANLSVAEKKAGNVVDIRYNIKASELADLEYQKSANANRRAAANDNGLIPVALMEVEKLKLAAGKAALAVEQAEHELQVNRLNVDVAKAELATYAVRSEFAGEVTRVFKKRGEAVRQGDPIVEILDTTRVRIEGRIRLADLRFAKKGGKVRVRLNVPDVDLPEEKEEFEGFITFVERVSDPITHETRVFAEVENPHNILRAGLTAEMILQPNP